MHLPRPNMDAKMREQLIKCEKEWGRQPFVTLACSGYADEHWQIWDPDKMLENGTGMPSFVVLQDGTVEAHPG